MPRPAPAFLNRLPTPVVANLRRLSNLRGFDLVDLTDLGDLSKMRLFWKVAPYTHVRWRRYVNIYYLAEEAERRHTPGSFVECGVWRGGCAAVMAWHAARAGAGRQTWLFDSFQGLPEPSAADGPEAAHYAEGQASGALNPIGRCVGTLDEVQHLFFEVLGLDGDYVNMVPGWFQDTLYKSRDAIGPIAILRLDADWYESTKLCLEALYDQVVPGGAVVLDDYGDWVGCKRAVDEFVAARNLTIDMVAIDRGGRYFRKP